MRSLALALFALALAACSTSEDGSSGGGESLGAGPHQHAGAGGQGQTTATGQGGAGLGSTSSVVGPGTTTTGPGGTTTTGPSTSVTSSAASTSSTGATSAASTGPGGQSMLPFGGSSGGSGGPVPVAGTQMTAGGIDYRLIVPSSYSGSPTPFLLVYSGTEGGSVMTMNLQAVAPSTGTSDFIEAVIDGVVYNGDANAGATVLDTVRSLYDIDDDRTYLLGESAGTSAAEGLAFHLRSPYFAAYWANDVNQVDTPGSTATTLGFAPWGQVGPGGETQIADAIVAGMQTAGYRLPNPAPYAGSGSGTHGDPNQFIAAVAFFVGKSRQ